MTTRIIVNGKRRPDLEARICPHPPERLYSGYANLPDGKGGLVRKIWIACCDCGAVLR